MQLQVGGMEPVGYDPCRPIHRVISKVGLPPGGDVIVREAVTTMSAASEPMADLLVAGRGDSARAVVEHEIGHVLGLNQIGDSSQLMSEKGGAVSGPADGDRRGLAILGRGACRPDL